MSESLSSIETRYRSITEQLAAPSRHVRFSVTPQYDEGKHVELRNGLYFYLTFERGDERDRRMTLDPNELLYWLVSDLTWAMAREYELSNRVANEDCRRLLFSKHLELLAQVDGKWSQKKRAEYDEILIRYPYRQSPYER